MALTSCQKSLQKLYPKMTEKDLKGATDSVEAKLAEMKNSADVNWRENFMKWLQEHMVEEMGVEQTRAQKTKILNLIKEEINKAHIANFKDHPVLAIKAAYGGFNKFDGKRKCT